MKVMKAAPPVPLGPPEENDVDADPPADLTRTFLPRSVREDLAVGTPPRRGALVEPFVVLDRLERLLEPAFVFSVGEESVEAPRLKPHRLPLVDFAGEN